MIRSLHQSRFASPVCTSSPANVCHRGRVPRFAARLTTRLAALTLAAALACVSGQALGQAGELTDDVRRLVNGRKWGEAKVGVSLYEVQSGAQLAGLRVDEPFIPASNMKLLSSGTAMMVLGPDFVFKTQLLLEGDRLIIRGDGDPSLADPEVLEKMNPKLTTKEMLSTLVNAVVKANPGKIREIIVDDRVFDRKLVHPSWPANQLSRGYCAQVAGVNFHANVLHFFPAPNPDGIGTPAIYSLQPAAPWIDVEVRSRTVKDGNNAAWLTRDEGENKFVLRGDVRHKSLSPIEATYHDPATFVGRLIASSLTDAGIKVPLSAVRLVNLGEEISGGRVVAVVSTPLSEVLKRCNTDSANLYAECLLKRAGHAVTDEPGSWANGATVVRMMLSEKVGPTAASTTIISDGSGMSRENAVSPSTLTRWLAAVASDKKIAEPFANSLAQIGSGTLRKRFGGVKLNHHLQAKSGYINGVRTLSGYICDLETGRKVAFSILVNNIKSDIAHASTLELHEDVVKLADKWLTQRAASQAPSVGG